MKPPMMLAARTWPAGTTKFVRVQYVHRVQYRGRILRLVACLDGAEPPDGFILNDRDDEGLAEAVPGEAGKITFTADAGPGHWSYARIERAD